LENLMRQALIRTLAAATVLVAVASSARAADTPTAAVPRAGAMDDPTGLWKTHHDHRVAIFHCGEELCAQVASMSNPYNADGSIRRDVRNPNPELRSRPIVGAPLFKHVVPAGPGQWKGEFYYPEGGTYQEGSLKMGPDGSVNFDACGAHGCSTRHWTRVH
jgi:uncharacterized protein (DUF2147 family)